jgi:restriction system protein
VADRWARVASGGSAAWAIVGIAVLVVAYPVLRWVGRLAARYTLMRHAAAITQQHMASLLRRRSQLVTLDPYGKPLFDRWDKEIAYFIAQHLEPSLASAEQASLLRNHDRVAALIATTVEAAFDVQPAFQLFSDDITPAQYENFCAEQLRQAGWSARVTMHSRDQGVDVIAEKDGRRIVLQCKLYARPVGNKSVQEAAAARAHEDADYAVVVSNNRFTPAAEQLAATNGVLLLHHRDLLGIDGLLDGRTS